ncbi:MAG: 4-hydroxy-3-methylbut-2-enyl diphosphate reductase [Prevotella sp.]|nr:4-hydroxy-3-methylbut-2-enyl diphosphate reductase [Prevotella sp.]
MSSLQIEIDEGSGFCFGVTTAIRKAEEELSKGSTLYCLGDIVHNGMEVERLHAHGLMTITHDDLHRLHDVKVLLRAHGEPPETYEIARRNNIEIIDATCPVVLQLQRRIKKQYDENNQPWLTPAPCQGASNLRGGGVRGGSENNQPQIVIFGKPGHAEVLGLVGQTDGEAIVIAKFEDVKLLDFTRDIYLYSQTTKSLDEFHRIISYIQEHIAPSATFKSYDTICRQVANRMPNIAAFAARHDLILFVSGRKSSNGRVLFNECKSVNPNSYQIERADEIDMSWLQGVHTIGICGATSTPKWLMEECRDYILRKERDVNIK